MSKMNQKYNMTLRHEMEISCARWTKSCGIHTQPRWQQRKQSSIMIAVVVEGYSNLHAYKGVLKHHIFVSTQRSLPLNIVPFGVLKTIFFLNIVVKLQPQSLVKRLGVDFVFTSSQWQWQAGSQPHQRRVLAGNLGSWIWYTNLF